MLITSLLWVQYIAAGGSGLFLMMHVRLMVDPLLMYISGPPRIKVIGSVITDKEALLQKGWLVGVERDAINQGGEEKKLGAELEKFVAQDSTRWGDLIFLIRKVR